MWKIDFMFHQIIYMQSNFAISISVRPRDIQGFKIQDHEQWLAGQKHIHDIWNINDADK